MAKSRCPQDELRAALAARNELEEDMDRRSWTHSSSGSSSGPPDGNARASSRCSISARLSRRRCWKRWISAPLFALAAIFTGLAGVIVVCAALAVVAIVSSR